MPEKEWDTEDKATPEVKAISPPPPVRPALPGVTALVQQRQDRMQWWGWLVAAPFMALVVVLVAIGGNTVTNHLFHIDAQAATIAPHRAAPRDPKPTAKPTPKQMVTYDLAGYQEAVGGPQEHAFASALNGLRADIATANYTLATHDAPQLVNAAQDWLAALMRTNPPPAYQAARALYVRAATDGTRAGNAMVNGLTSLNTALFHRASVQAWRARFALLKAQAGKIPQGS